jgi:hypothetical protein
MPAGAVYVGRGSRYGNPWRVVKSGRFTLDGAPAWSGRGDWEINYPVVRDRSEAAQRACDCFRAWLQTPAGQIELAPLRGRDLVCWCPLDQPCHADVLIEIANG